MKNTLKSFALLCMGLAIIGCVEDNLEPENGGSYKEGEIVFTATAVAEKVTTKTVYGDPINGSIPVMWEHGDRIQIVCPQSEEVQSVEYSIGTTDKTANSKAATIAKTGDIGLRWSDATTHNFYAMYPSPASSAATTDAITLDTNDGTSVIMTGHIPASQKELKVTESTVGTNKHYIYEPDMSYAYMVAEGTSTNNGEQTPDGVKLNFSPLFTTLQFDLSIPSIGNVTTDNYIWLKSVTVKSTNSVIAGDLTYKFTATTPESKLTASSAATPSVSIEFANYVALAAGDVCTVTLFILPTYSTVAGSKDLKLTVEYMNAGKMFSKTATINVAITPYKKHHFKDVNLPEISDISGGSWMDLLDPSTPYSNLSIPVAGNAFTSYYSTTSPQYYHEQTLGLEALWNLGVRGFEFCTSTAVNGSLGNSPFVCNGSGLSSATLSDGTTLNFGSAFDFLVDQVKNNSTECAIIIATYKSYTGGGNYSPQQYITDLSAFLTAKITEDADLEDMITSLNPETTLRDLKGKIAIIVRPGDNEYINHVGQTFPLTNESQYFTVVQDWGTAVDCWDRRFEGCLREKAFAQQNVTTSNEVSFGSTYVEDFLYAETVNQRTNPPTYPTGYTSLKGSKKYTFNTTINSNSGPAYYIQEWARVIPSNGISTYTGLYYDTYAGVLQSDYHYLWVNWPESFGEKKAMILETLNAANTKSAIYINSLCGYYATTAHPQSIYPYMTWGRNRYDTSDQNIINNPGMGGDIPGLAADLNIYLRNEIQSRLSAGTIGSMGLIMMNCIGSSASDFATSEYVTDGGIAAAEASAQLPGLIIMSNFRSSSSADPAIAKSTASVKSWADEDCNGDSTETTIVWE